ncbi:hypothetical protein DFJ74DRAFT_697658 [Hyaloraphidium curvatum]|nr:hypothetical protein DFJ74DRAFT_697658 [Hyaloraphidium curvatum]
MCYSASASAQALAIGLGGSLLLWFLPHRHRPLGREHRALGLFFGFVSLMQLWDYLLWSNPPGTKANLWATRAATVTNHLEPVVLALAMRFLRGRRLPLLTLLALSLYLLVAVPYTLRCLREVRGTAASPRSAPSLDWEWNHLPGNSFVYLAFLVSFDTSMWQNLRTPRIRWLALLLTNATFAFSMWRFYVHAGVGRFWCYFAAACPLFFLLQSDISEKPVERKD